eukprot:TRINITY_DN33165_c0_g1_i1.p1 TRINITY_DN33165_c0_g1~~TRINITY_DN33165_c0_g1_i1.p1  ORF type:complete len:344 (-),score=30.67 TRINITY_DN33165_c0_g1_i1:66-1097(-)
MSPVKYIYLFSLWISLVIAEQCSSSTLSNPQHGRWDRGCTTECQLQCVTGFHALKDSSLAVCSRGKWLNSQARCVSHIWHGGQTIQQGIAYLSENREFYLTYHADGQLTITNRRTTATVWTSFVGRGSEIRFENSNQLVVYNTHQERVGIALKSQTTTGHGVKGGTLVFTNTGSLQVRDATGRQIAATPTTAEQHAKSKFHIDAEKRDSPYANLHVRGAREQGTKMNTFVRVATFALGVVGGMAGVILGAFVGFRRPGCAPPPQQRRRPHAPQPTSQGSTPKRGTSFVNRSNDYSTVDEDSGSNSNSRASVDSQGSVVFGTAAQVEMPEVVVHGGAMEPQVTL